VPDLGPEFRGEQSGQLGGRTDPAEQRGKRALDACVLVDEHADAALVTKDFERFGEALLARK